MNDDTTRTYDLKPSKEAYRAVKSDVTPVSAFKELIDNALDNWQRVSEKVDDIDIDIIHRERNENGNEELVIRDNTGGVEEDEVSMLFALGQSQKDAINGSIGAYGIGAKKAIINLGNTATIRSRYLRSNTGFGFTIDEDWLNTDDDWSVEKKEYNDIDAGITEIIIRDLNIDWGDYEGDLEKDLAETYQRFLRSDDKDRGDVNITIRDEFTEEDSDDIVTEETSVSAPEEIEWSYTPLDGYFVRKYKDIKLESREFDDTVYLTITVGLMRSANAQKAGADIFCQNRKVLSAVRDERAAFGTGSGSQRLNDFSNQHHRLRLVIDFYTEGDARDLPWDAQKSDIDPYNRVAQAAHGWIRRVARRYQQAAGDFDNFSTDFLRPYDKDSPYAVISGIEGYDYSNRERVMDKPQKKYPTVMRLGRIITVSKKLGIYSPDAFEEKYQPAYEEAMRRYLNSSNSPYEIGKSVHKDDIVITDHLTEVSGLPDDIDEETAKNVLDTLEGKVRDHTSGEAKKRATGLSNWQQAIYDRLLRDALDEQGIDTDLEDLEAVDSEEVEITTSDSSDNDAGDGDNNEQATFGGSSGGDDTTSGSLFGDETKEDVIEGVTGSVSKNGDDEDNSRGVVERTIDEIEASMSSGGLGTVESGTKVLRMDEEQYEQLVSSLGLEDDASEDEVVDKLMDTMNVVRQLTTPSSD